jgi:hypothetical protein
MPRLLLHQKGKRFRNIVRKSSNAKIRHKNLEIRALKMEHESLFE